MAYIGSSPTKVVSRQSANIFTYTATANQTAFTGSDANGNTLACSPSDIMVHMNGIKLEESDYTASTTTVTLGSGAAAGDEVTITAFLTFESADHYTKSAADTRYVNTSGDTMTGDLSVTGDLFVTNSTNAKLSVSDNISEVGSGNLALQAQNSASSALKPMGFRAEDFRYAIGSNEVMKIDSSGRVTKPTQAYGEAEGNNSGLLTGFSTGTVINWFTANHLNGGMSFSNNGRFTVPVDGRYLINAQIYYYPGGSHTAYYALDLLKNGNLECFTIDDHVESVSGNIDRTVQLNMMVRASANDYFELRWGSNINGQFWRGAEHNKFRILLLG